MAAIAGERQEIDLLAFDDRAMLSQIWEFRSSHQNQNQNQWNECTATARRNRNEFYNKTIQYGTTEYWSSGICCRNRMSQGFVSADTERRRIRGIPSPRWARPERETKSFASRPNISFKNQRQEICFFFFRCNFYGRIVYQSPLGLINNALYFLCTEYSLYTTKKKTLCSVLS